MIRGLYDWTVRQAQRPYALWMLAFVAFVESSIFPIPPDVLLIPMVIAAPSKAFRIALVCTVASVVGGMAGYAIGALAIETIGRPVLEFYGSEQEFEHFTTLYNQYGAWAVLIAGITPFPFKIITILSGLTGMSILVFVVASIIARAARFFLVAALLWRFGEPIRLFIEKRLNLVVTLGFLLLIGGFAVIKWL